MKCAASREELESDEKVINFQRHALDAGNRGKKIVPEKRGKERKRGGRTKVNQARSLLFIGTSFNHSILSLYGSVKGSHGHKRLKSVPSLKGRS